MVICQVEPIQKIIKTWWSCNFNIDPEIIILYYNEECLLIQNILPVRISLTIEMIRNQITVDLFDDTNHMVFPFSFLEIVVHPGTTYHSATSYNQAKHFLFKSKMFELIGLTGYIQ